MKKIAILSNYQNSFSFSEKQILSYSQLTQIFRENGLDLKRVSMHSFDPIQGVFTDYVDMDENGEFKIIYEDYRPDIIWNRSRDGQLSFYSQIEGFFAPIIPSSQLVSIASDKYEMYCFLKDYQPQTLLLKDFFAYPELRKNLTDRVVLKPIRSNSGKGILFMTQAELIEKKESYEGLEALFIVQEFLDFHEGVPGLVEGIHDVRLVYIGGKYSHATLRQPKKGGLKSNVGSGGSESCLEYHMIPIHLFELAEKVIHLIRIDPKVNIYSIDFGYIASQNKWYVFEINSSPGVLLDEKDGNTYQGFTHTYFPNLASFFKSQG